MRMPEIVQIKPVVGAAALGHRCVQVGQRCRHATTAVSTDNEHIVAGVAGRNAEVECFARQRMARQIKRTDTRRRGRHIERRQTDSILLH